MHIKLSDTIKFKDSYGTEINAGPRFSLTTRREKAGWYLVIIDFHTGEEYQENFFDKDKSIISSRYETYKKNDEIDLSSWTFIEYDEDEDNDE